MRLTFAWLALLTYVPSDIEGWHVQIERAFQQDHADTLDQVTTELRHQLYQIERKVPPQAVEKLRRVTIWIHYNSKTPCMTYHPSREWLEEHGYNPAMARGVEIGNAKNFLDWTKQQPWMVLHELAHAYHDQVLGFDDQRIREAFAAAQKSGIYEDVLHINGKKQRHYALTNPKEYFAESTEAFFGTNDFYPFVRAELKQHDPRIYEILEQVW